VALLAPDDPNTLLTRKATAEALNATGYPVRPATLATKASPIVAALARLDRLKLAGHEIGQHVRVRIFEEAEAVPQQIEMLIGDWCSQALPEGQEPTVTANRFRGANPAARWSDLP
jgi:hypothetical protein